MADEPTTTIGYQRREVVRVTGRDATAYLQSQLSQDVASLPLDGVARSFLLEPSGHVVGWFRVLRIGTDEYLFETDADVGAGDAIVARLTRFKLRMDVELAVESWKSFRLRGAMAPEMAEQLERDAAAAEMEWGFVASPTLDWPGVEGVDLLAPSGDRPVEPNDDGPREWMRIVAGVPRAGTDFAVDGTTIPAELGEWALTSAVDFTKGCYTGQELVARVDSRGNHVPKPLRLLRLDDEVPPRGATVLVEGRESGHVTSSARTPEGGGVALAVVARRVEVPAAVVVAWDGFEANARAESLPTGG
jgi:folate-binding protein YgfZ